MRVRHLTAIALTAATVTIAASLPAAAGDIDHGRSGYVWGIFPGGPDPYEYRSIPVGYYPYYGSGYWKTRAEMRYRYRKPLLVGEYWSAWSYPVKCVERACRTKTAHRRPTK